MCEVVDQQGDRKFDSQTVDSATALCCRTNMDTESRSHIMDVNNNNQNMPHGFRSNINGQTRKNAD